MTSGNQRYLGGSVSHDELMHVLRLRGEVERLRSLNASLVPELLFLELEEELSRELPEAKKRAADLEALGTDNPTVVQFNGSARTKLTELAGNSFVVGSFPPGLVAISAIASHDINTTLAAVSAAAGLPLYLNGFAMAGRRWAHRRSRDHIDVARYQQIAAKTLGRMRFVGLMQASARIPLLAGLATYVAQNPTLGRLAAGGLIEASFEMNAADLRDARRKVSIYAAAAGITAKRVNDDRAEARQELTDLQQLDRSVSGRTYSVDTAVEPEWLEGRALQSAVDEYRTSLHTFASVVCPRTASKRRDIPRKVRKLLPIGPATNPELFAEGLVAICEIEAQLPSAGPAQKRLVLIRDQMAHGRAGHVESFTVPPTNGDLGEIRISLIDPGQLPGSL